MAFKIEKIDFIAACDSKPPPMVKIEKQVLPNGKTMRNSTGVFINT